MIAVNAVCHKVSSSSPKTKQTTIVPHLERDLLITGGMLSLPKHKYF